MEQDLIIKIINEIAESFVHHLVNLSPKDYEILQGRINANQELIRSLSESSENNLAFYRDMVIHHLDTLVNQKSIASVSNVLLLLGLTAIKNISMTDFLFDDNYNKDAQNLHGFLRAKELQEQESLPNQHQPATPLRAATIFSTNGATSSSNPSLLHTNVPIVDRSLSVTFKPEEYFQDWYNAVKLGNVNNLSRLINSSGLTTEQVAQVINFLPHDCTGYGTDNNSLFLEALENENLDMAEFLFNHGGDIRVAKPDGINAIHMLAMVHPDSDPMAINKERLTDRISLSEDVARRKIIKLRSLLQTLQQSDRNKFNQLINTPRITSPVNGQPYIGTGVPLLKVIAYCNDPQYIADMITAWQQVGATIKPDQLHTIWPKCMGKPEAYLAKIEELFPECFDLVQLIKPHKGENAFEFVIDRTDYTMLNYLIKRHHASIRTDANLKKSIMVAHKKKFLDLFKDNFLSCFNDFCLKNLGNEGITSNLIEFNQRVEKQFIENIELMKFHQQSDFYDPNLQQELISWLEERQMPRIRNIITTDAAKQIELAAKQLIKRSTYSSDSSNRCISRPRLTT